MGMRILDHLALIVDDLDSCARILAAWGLPLGIAEEQESENTREVNVDTTNSFASTAGQARPTIADPARRGVRLATSSRIHRSVRGRFPLVRRFRNGTNRPA